MKLVAVRYLDGRLVKGRTADFKPGCATFHVRLEDGTTAHVETGGLKAVFLIKTVAGDPNHTERKDFGLKNTAEKRIWIEFEDGEQLAGWSTSHASGKAFFVTPTDPHSNLERAYVYKAAVRRILEGAQAEQAAAAYRPPAGTS